MWEKSGSGGQWYRFVVQSQKVMGLVSNEKKTNLSHKIKLPEKIIF